MWTAKWLLNFIIAKKRYYKYDKILQFKTNNNITIVKEKWLTLKQNYGKFNH